MSGGVNRALSVKLRKKLSCAGLRVHPSNLRVRRSKSVTTLDVEDGILMTKYEHTKLSVFHARHDSDEVGI